jgi:ppGpp synthetase/RelA/SpoT-type nucleotidyltranferase
MVNFQDTENEIRALLHGAEKLRPRLEAAILAHPLFNKSYFRVTSRIKTLQRAFDKFNRLRITKPDASPQDIHDLIGIRVITPFNATVIEALDAVFDIIHHTGVVGGISPFKKGDYRSILYTARPDNDPLSLKHSVDHWIQSRGIDPSRHDSFTPDTLYSSEHLIAYIIVPIEQSNGPDVEVMIPVEIQFRTIMEDFWSQLSHITSYSIPSSSTSTGKHLNALKQLIDGCALYADIIRVDSDAAIEAVRELRETPQSAGDAYLSSREIPRDIVVAFNAALDHRKAAGLMMQPSAAATLEYLEAAQKFSIIEDSLRAIGDEIEKAEAIYRTQMERAFCLMYSDDDNSKDEAFKLYKAISEASMDDAISRFRLGQCLRKRREFEKATSIFEETIDILENNRDKRVGPNNWVRGAVYVELGYAHFYTMGQTEDIDVQRNELRTAIDVTTKGFRKLQLTDALEGDRLSSVNNLIYYSYEEWSRFNERSVSDEKFREYLSLIPPERIFAILPLHKQDTMLDTIVKANLYIGDKATAGKVASSVVRVLREKAKRRSGGGDLDYASVQKHLSEDEFDTYLFSVDVLASRSVE